MTGATSLRANSSTVARSAEYSSLSSMVCPPCSRLNDQQHSVALDGGSGAGPQVTNHAVDRRGEHMLHLHRFEHEQPGTCGDLLTLGDVDGDDGAGHRCGHRPGGALLAGPRGVERLLLVQLPA